MLRIRLRRVGKKGKPSYRIVVAESSAPRDGAYVEWIGNYDPMADPPAVTLKADRAAEWLSKGAQPSDAVRRIFDWNGLLKRTPEQRAGTKASDAQVEEAAVPAAVAVAEEEEAAPAAVAVADEVEDDEATVQAPEEETDSEATAAEVTDELTDESTGDAAPDEALEESSDSEAESEVTDQASDDGEADEVSKE